METVNSLLLGDQIEFILNVIVKKAKLEKNGVFWYTDGGSNLYSKSKNESIVNGGCGIILFLIEVYQTKKEPALLEVIRLGIDWAIDYTQKAKSPFSFYTGKAGVVYTALKAYEITHDDQFLKKSELLVEGTDLDEWIDSHDVELNLYEGLAGALLVLLHLHSCTQSNRMLEIIGKLTARLLHEVKIATSGGIYWSRGRQFNQVKELCGFAEGTAGISYVFTELGAYFRNPAFFWIARQSAIYENSFYNEKQQNWPDFHKGRITKDELRKLSLKHKWGISKSYFTEPAYSDSWDHGRTGIALSRARCYQATRNEKCAEDLEKAARGVAYCLNKSSYSGNYITLKQGLPGAIMLMLEAYHSIKEPLFLDTAKQAARTLWKISAKKLCNNKNVGTVDPTLFTGAAGIGYCLVALAHAEQGRHSSCITRPDVPTSEENLNRLLPSVLQFSEHDIIGCVLQSNFPKTFNLLKKNKLTESICQFTQKNSTTQIVQDLSAKITSSGFLQLKDILEYEQGKRALISSVPSKLDLRIKKYNEALLTKPILEINHATLVRLKLVAASGTKIHTSKWPWHSEESEGSNEELDEEYFTLFSTGGCESIEEYWLDKTSAYFLSKFTRPIRPVDVFNQICKENNIHENEKNELMGVLTQQLIYFLTTGAIVRVSAVENLLSNRN